MHCILTQCTWLFELFVGRQRVATVLKLDVKEKNEKLFNNDVEQKYDGKREETGLQGLSEKVLDENQSEDYNQSVVISTHSTKIVISYK